jgi:hypothetical protein
MSVEPFEDFTEYREPTFIQPKKKRRGAGHRVSSYGYLAACPVCGMQWR